MNAHIRTLKPLGCPQGVDPRTWRQSVEKRLNDLLDRAMSLITALDLMEADCDLEETADDEPSLGCLDDLEQDNCDDEDGGDTEPNGDETDYSATEDEMGTCDERDPAAAPMARQAMQRLREIQQVPS
ncbi:hypothetical protein B5V02_15085 [Mesorhizobium kowhaii]|uniref:Uncharacterized protein n=2 Tax=Mesorhizobium kowhaii TaxID=1300272 RepID=A0A2W7C400_9HYPH|nr:hypothetical protein B5V02_15085 [Mesorhizobium kowhaii]